MIMKLPRSISIIPLVIVLCAATGCLPVKKNVLKLPTAEVLSENLLYSSFILTSDDKKLMDSIRRALVYNESIKIPKNYDFSFKFDSNYSWVSITLYQEVLKPLRFVSKRRSLEETLNRIVSKLKQKNRYSKFDVSNSFKVRIGFEIVTTPLKKVDISKLSCNSLGSNRFEIGIDGLMIKTDNKIYFFMPSDGYTKNKLYLNDVIKWFKDKYDVRSKDCDFYKFNSKSFITFKDNVLGLYRGYPIKKSYTIDDLRKTVFNGLDWLVEHQGENGKFIYFVDSITGETKNYLYDRSKLLKELGMKEYYNILRHLGASLCLLRGYEIMGDEKYLNAVKKGLDYVLRVIVTRKVENDDDAVYVFFNKKAKLGGSGLALALFSRYQQITKDDEYYNVARKLAVHILDQIGESGEFNYYYIHHLHGKKPKSDFFSFYYPGEALLGLADFYKICKNDVFRQRIEKKAEKALDFLLFIRPKKYKQYYESLPSDSWLMSAILELAKIPKLNKQAYKNFVYSDALKMVKHQYTFKDALYPDYVGGFYYNYGDHVYPDGARAEGLFSAYELANREGKSQLASSFLKSLKLAALCQLHLVNTVESIYPSINYSMVLGGVRFKLTRQWFRIDTIQHVANFYMRLLNRKEIEDREE